MAEKIEVRSDKVNLMDVRLSECVASTSVEALDAGGCSSDATRVPNEDDLMGGRAFSDVLVVALGQLMSSLAKYSDMSF